MHTCSESKRYDGKIWVCAGNQFKNSSNSDVVFLEGFNSYFLVEYLQKINLNDFLNK